MRHSTIVPRCRCTLVKSCDTTRPRVLRATYRMLLSRCNRNLKRKTDHATTKTKKTATRKPHVKHYNGAVQQGRGEGGGVGVRCASVFTRSSGPHQFHRLFGLNVRCHQNVHAPRILHIYSEVYLPSCPDQAHEKTQEAGDDLPILRSEKNATALPHYQKAPPKRLRRLACSQPNTYK